MPWLWWMIALAIACLAGFVGIAIVSTMAGQYVIAGVVCAIATYWLTLASDHHRPVH